MLIHKTDYLTIDAYDIDRIQLNNRRQLLLTINITAQCNGKLKRIHYSFEAEVQGKELNLKNRNEAYILREVMIGLGYDMPDVTKTIRKALSTLFGGVYSSEINPATIKLIPTLPNEVIDTRQSNTTTNCLENDSSFTYAN